MKTRGVIASGHELTSQAGKVILEEGGNAFDAALAALFASFVCEPCMSSPGGGGFMAGLFHNKAVFQDFFCQTPLRNEQEQLDFSPIEVNFGAVSETFFIGKGSIAVPGNIAGAFRIHQKYCTLPIKVIAEYALQLAKEGVIVNDFQEYDFKLLKPILDITNGVKDVFYRTGELAKKGDLTVMSEFADLLDTLCHEGPRLFYEGEIAKQMELDVAANGGFLHREDMRAYEVLERDPIHFRLNGFDIYTNPPPSAGGTILRLIFDSLWSDHLISGLSSEDWLGLVCQTFDKVEKVRSSSGAFESYQDSIYPKKTQWGSTTHLSVMDEHGNAAAISTTNGQGSGYTVPGTQVMMNNMLGEGALFPMGFHNWAADTRVPSMMSPTVVSHPEKEMRIAMGTGGAGRIPYSIAQVMINLILDQTFGKAIDSPRVYLEKGTLNHEPGIEIPSKLPPMVKKVISWEQNDMFFGGVHTVVKKKDKLKGIGDKRRHGIVEYVT